MEPYLDYGMLDSARRIYADVVEELFRRKHVIACGLGFKTREGRVTSQLSLVVSVTHKVPASELAATDLVPQRVSGLETDVIETGRIRAQAENPQARWRPAQPGVSIGHRDITAGTLGLLVQREGQVYILSNNHILANSNAAAVGDPIYQPAPADGGIHNDKIASLAAFEPLDFGDAPATCRTAEALARVLNVVARLAGSSHRLQPIQATPAINQMDAALALPDQPSLVKPDVLGIGLPSGAVAPQLGEEVQKMGRTTGYTMGFVTQINVTVDVDYAGRTARFVDQVFATPMSSPGDSGSGIFNMDREVVGLLFAGSERVTIFTPIQRVLDRFEVDAVTT